MQQSFCLCNGKIKRIQLISSSHELVLPTGQNRPTALELLIEIVGHCWYSCHRCSKASLEFSERWGKGEETDYRCTGSLVINPSSSVSTYSVLLKKRKVLAPHNRGNFQFLQCFLQSLCDRQAGKAACTAEYPSGSNISPKAGPYLHNSLLSDTFLWLFVV